MIYGVGQVIEPFSQDREQEMWLAEINRYASTPDENQVKWGEAPVTHEGCIEIRAWTRAEAEFLAKEIVTLLNTNECMFRRALMVPKAKLSDYE